MKCLFCYEVEEGEPRHWQSTLNTQFIADKKGKIMPTMG